VADPKIQKKPEQPKKILLIWRLSNIFWTKWLSHFSNEIKIEQIRINSGHFSDTPYNRVCCYIIQMKYFLSFCCKWTNFWDILNRASTLLRWSIGRASSVNILVCKILKIVLLVVLSQIAKIWHSDMVLGIKIGYLPFQMKLKLSKLGRKLESFWDTLPCKQYEFLRFLFRWRTQKFKKNLNKQKKFS